jgi:hypothetical protein
MGSRLDTRSPVHMSHLHDQPTTGLEFCKEHGAQPPRQVEKGLAARFLTM